MAHHPKCNDFRGMDPGFAAATGDGFIAKYRDRFDRFHIHTFKNCLGCCLAYLTVNRNYTRVHTQSGQFYVHFPVGNPPDRFRIPPVTGLARKPLGPKGKMGQIATGDDHDLGEPFRRTFQASRTYRLYVPKGDAARGLSIGFSCNARMESVAIDVVDQVKHRDIADMKLNFADAMLVERYKEMSNKPKSPQIRISFRGFCMTPPVPVQVDALVEGMQNVAINHQPN